MPTRRSFSARPCAWRAAAQTLVGMLAARRAPGRSVRLSDGLRNRVDGAGGLPSVPGQPTFRERSGSRGAACPAGQAASPVQPATLVAVGDFRSVRRRRRLAVRVVGVLLWEMDAGESRLCGRRRIHHRLLDRARTNPSSRLRSHHLGPRRPVRFGCGSSS